MTDTKKRPDAEEKEEMLAEVEMLMLKGTKNATVIARHIKRSVPTASSYVKIVQKRWSLSKNNDWMDMQIEQIEKSRVLEEAYWKTYKKADNSSAAIGALHGILEVHKHQSWLVGLKKFAEKK